MLPNQFFLALFLLAWSSTLNAADKAAGRPPAQSAAAPKATNAQVVAYYFHGNIRCETCKKIEKEAREIIEQQFLIQIAEKRLCFEPVNYDKPENRAYLEKYKLPCPSLVLVLRKDGKDEKWKLLEATWEHVENPIKFKDYIEGEVSKFLPKSK